MIFATTLRSSLSWLAGRYWIAAVLGGIFGPVSYYARQEFGSLSLGLNLRVTVDFVRSLGGAHDVAGLVGSCAVRERAVSLNAWTTWPQAVPSPLRQPVRWNAGARPTGRFMEAGRSRELHSDRPISRRSPPLQRRLP